MDLDLVKNTFQGFSVGYNYADFKNKEDEIKQGKNYYLSSMQISGQLQMLGVLISSINSSLPNHLFKVPITILCNVGPIIGFGGALACAAVKHGHYEQLVSEYNKLLYAYLPLPEKLSGRAVSSFSFFAEHGGDMIRVGVVTASVAMIMLGNVACGGAVFTAMTYRFMDQKRLIPLPISLFMEIYMPMISSISLLIQGNFITRLFSAISLTRCGPSSLTQMIDHRFDQIFRFFAEKHFKLVSEGFFGPTLNEIEAPLIKSNNMNLNEINKILDFHELDFGYAYKINPAHCSKNVVNSDNLPVDYAFKKFIPLFDQIDWESKYFLIVGQLKHDDRFIDFLFTKFPEENKKNLADKIDDFIQQLAAKDKTTSEKYVTKWIREQIVELISVLQGEKRVKGTLQDLYEAIYSSSRILPYLSSLKNPIELEDVLLKLAVEGGGYCARGLKRATGQVLDSAIEGGTLADKLGDDFKGNYELKVSQSLQNKRGMIMQALYKKMMDSVEIPGTLADDIHGFDIYRLYFSLGFFPLTKFERSKMEFIELIGWATYSQYRDGMYSDYHEALDSVIHDLGEAEFGVYMLQVINENVVLSDNEKEQLLEKFTERNNGQWSVKETQERFHRLLLVKLGVLIPA